VRLRVWVDDDPGNELHALRGWLQDEPAVRQFGSLATDRAADPGSMGTAEVLSLAVGSGLSIAQLFLAIAAWRTTRPKRYVIRVQRDGRTVEVGTDDEAELRELAQELEGAIGDRPGAD
jgi:hypothetical protein